LRWNATPVFICASTKAHVITNAIMLNPNRDIVRFVHVPLGLRFIICVKYEIFRERWLYVNPNLSAPLKANMTAVYAFDQYGKRDVLYLPFIFESFVDAIPNDQYTLGFYREEIHKTSGPPYDYLFQKRRFNIATPFITANNEGELIGYLNGNVEPLLSLKSEKMTTGIGSPFFYGKFENLENSIRIKSGQSSHIYLFLSPNYDLIQPGHQISYELYQEGELIVKNNFVFAQLLKCVPEYETIPINPGTYTLQIPFELFSIDEQPGKAIARATFNTNLIDKNPPFIKSFKIISDDQITDALDNDAKNEVVFNVDDDSDVNQVSIYLRENGEISWSELPFILSDSLYKTDLSSLSKRGYYDLRVLLEDSYSNKLDYILTPAFRNGRTNKKPVIQKIQDIVFAITDTFSLNLNNYVIDPDNPDSSLSWTSISMNDSLKITIDNSINHATIFSDGFTGITDVIFSVTDDSLAFDIDTVSVQVSAAGGITAGLILNMENNLKDGLGKANDAVDFFHNSSITFGSNITPIPQGSFYAEFDGISDQAIVIDQYNSELDIDDNLCIEAWIYPNTSNRGTIVSKYGAYELRLLTANRLSFYIYSDGSMHTLSHFSQTISLNKWTHVAGTYSTKKGMAIFINDIMVESSINTFRKIDQNDSPVRIGSPGGAYYFNGFLDEVKILNGIYFSATNVSLNTNWNLVSWNYELQSISPQNVFSDIMDNITVILGFEDEGLTYDPSLISYNNLTTVDNIHGYWIKMKQQDNFYIKGNHVNPQTPVYLEAGWNLISYLPQDADSLKNAMQSVLDNVIIIKSYDQGGLTYIPSLPDSINTLNIMLPNYGYWLRLKQNCTLFYPVESKINTPELSLAKANNIIPHSDKIIPTNEWINVYASYLSINDNPLPAGSMIYAKDPDGIICGELKVRQTGFFELLPIYKDDPTTPNIDEGAQYGDSISLFINNVQLPIIFNFETKDQVVNISDQITKIDNISTKPPNTFALKQNYPNPFNPTCNINYQVPKSSKVKITVYNVLGEKISVLFDDSKNPGYYQLKWDGKNKHGNTCATGIYFYKMEAGDYIKTKKMILIR
jgi:hypothetical protein